MGSIFREKIADTTKTTCIEITAESYKCIDISAFVPQCITITSNVPTSELYQEQYNRDDVETTDAPILEIILINNEAPVLNVNLDEEGTIYVTDFDVVYIKITNWDTEVEYVNLFSNEDGNDAVVYLDEAEERIVWALDDYALDGAQMWFYAQAKASDKLISPQANVTVMQMEQTDTPVLSRQFIADELTIVNITIENYDATYTYSEPIVSGGTAVRTDNIIEWTLPNVTSDTYHNISIKAVGPLMYESEIGTTNGLVKDIPNECSIDWSKPLTCNVSSVELASTITVHLNNLYGGACFNIGSGRTNAIVDGCTTGFQTQPNKIQCTVAIALTSSCYHTLISADPDGNPYVSVYYTNLSPIKGTCLEQVVTLKAFIDSQSFNSGLELNNAIISHMGRGSIEYP